MDCPIEIKQKCEAFINDMGRECHYIPSIKEVCPYAIENGGCKECGWYKIVQNE